MPNVFKVFFIVQIKIKYGKIRTTIQKARSERGE